MLKGKFLHSPTLPMVSSFARLIHYFGENWQYCEIESNVLRILILLTNHMYSGKFTSLYPDLQIVVALRVTLEIELRSFRQRFVSQMVSSQTSIDHSKVFYLREQQLDPLHSKGEFASQITI